MREVFADKKWVRDGKWDSTLDFLRDGYTFISKRREELRSDMFQTRLLLHKTLCLSGQDASQLFYNPHYFQRKGAAPVRVQETLTGKGGVQSLDGEAHRNRKAMFMSLMSEPSLSRWECLFYHEWQAAIAEWSNREEIILFEEAQVLLCRAACKWANVPLHPEEVRDKAAQMGQMVDGFATLGLRYLRGRLARRHAESWMTGIVRQVRGGKIYPDVGSALHTIAWHRDTKGQLLKARIAAVEVLNIIRPIVAIATYITFTACALEQFPAAKKQLMAGKGKYDRWFVQEVRRYCPFTPFVGARVKSSFSWQGYTFRKGQRVLLDVYGMLHDPKLWERPEEFSPERFRHWQPNAFGFIPQGGGDHFTHHRCAGEWLTIMTIKAALDCLLRRMEYTIPQQDMSFSLSRIPALPKSGVILRGVRGTPQWEIAKVS